MKAIFRRADGTTLEREISFTDLRNANVVGIYYRIDGEEATRDIEAEMRRDGTWREKPKKICTSSLLWNRPFHSDALGVEINQIGEARETLRKAGVPTEYDSEGCAIITSERHYQAVCKALGMKTGRDGFAVKDDSGVTVLTGREPVKARERAKRAIYEAAGLPLR